MYECDNTTKSINIFVVPKSLDDMWLENDATKSSIYRKVCVQNFVLLVINYLTKTIHIITWTKDVNLGFFSYPFEESIKSYVGVDVSQFLKNIKYHIYVQ